MVDKEKLVKEFDKEMEKQIGELFEKISIFFKGMDKIELSLFIAFLLCVLISISLFGLAAQELMKNKDCYQSEFTLSHIEEDKNKDLFEKETVYIGNNISINISGQINKASFRDYNNFIVYGVEDGLNVSHEVTEKLSLYELRSMFPKGSYYLNYCPEKQVDGSSIFLVKGLIDANKINKFIFRRN